MNLKHKQRRIDGKAKWYWVDLDTGIEYAKKPVPRKQRSDKKAVSQNNVITVALRLLSEYEVALTTALDAVYADTGDIEYLEQLKLVAATKDILSDVVFLAAFCQPSWKYYNDKAQLALKLSYKFIIEFFPDEIQNVDNLNAATFRTRRVFRESVELDAGEESVNSGFRFADNKTIDAVNLYLKM